MLSRTSSRNGVTISTASAVAAVPSGPPAIRSAIRATARSAIAALSGSTVVNVGTVYAPSSLPSKPTTARSSGTRLPCSAAARSAPTASRSLKQNTASGGVGRLGQGQQGPHRLRAVAAVVLRGLGHQLGDDRQPGGGEGGPVARVGIQPIVATLALLVGGRGLALVIAGGQLRDVRTTFGRHLVAVGGNRAAARLAGLPVSRVLVSVYAISGVLAATAGVLAAARLGAGDPANTGLLFELSAIAAVVVGGTPLSGGQVRIAGTVAGVVLMQLVSATLIKNNLPNSSALMVQAVIIIAAVWAARERAR